MLREKISSNRNGVEHIGLCPEKADPPNQRTPNGGNDNSSPNLLRDAFYLICVGYSPFFAMGILSWVRSHFWDSIFIYRSRAIVPSRNIHKVPILHHLAHWRPQENEPTAKIIELLQLSLWALRRSSGA
jgi:hypothetical protein